MTVLLMIWRLFPPKTWALIAIGVACLTLVGVARCSHDRAEAERAAREAAEARAEALERRQAADAAAAERRLTDALKSQAATEELHDAVDSLPDARPSDRRIALACARLRRQGSSLPPVCGPEA